MRLRYKNPRTKVLVELEKQKNLGYVTQGEYDTLKAQIAAAASVTVSENNKAGTIGAAGINAGAKKYDSDKQYDSDVYKADSEADAAY